jgi:hypothetical protein
MTNTLTLLPPGFETTLAIVRELSENAIHRPAPKRLQFDRLVDRSPSARPALIAFEELHRPKFGGDLGTAHNHTRRTPRRAAPGTWSRLS